MYNVSMRMVHIKEDAEDIVQDSFVEAFNNLDTYRYQSSFGSWLKRIVINRSINFLKKRKIAVIPFNNESFHLATDIPCKDEEITVEIEKVNKGIRLLPSGYQQILNLYLIEGYDHVEIGEILGISQSTSKSQYHRAKKKLIDIIKSL
ncbi:sigma-70 family RNA polymerase sigma factor [Snuella sp. CAU 1569]|uniref:RNA polymerase sigma factor n=2 Tax=Snuella sedimenti TaxID=2798802 RepID=A0A8J7II55_9FLAO|nr:sigma-70 family RNA polymerase sigma factor [Snuella sedimenti]